MYNNYIREGRLGAMRQNLHTLRVALEDFRLENVAGNYGAAATYSTTAAINTQYGWQPDGDAGRYTYGARVTAGATPSYDVWAIDPVARVWLRCDNRMNRCCDGTGTTTTACP